MAIQQKKILSIAILASILVFSFTVSSSTAISFAQREGSSGGGNQAAAQNSQDGNNDSDSGVSQSSSSSQSSECASEGSTVGSCNNISVQANKNGNDEEEPKQATVNPETESPEATEATTAPISASVSCGEVIKQSVKLTSNLDCKTDGIIIGADGITVDLNGYSITGPGTDSSKVALMLSDKDNVNIEGPGILKNFQAGVLNTGGTGNTISGVTFTEDQIGSFNTGAAKTTLENNMFLSNNIGVASHTSEETELLTNLFKSNELAGATFVNSAENEVAYNTIQGSVSGLYFDGQSSDNTVNANNILDNKGVDINNANGLPLNVNNNLFSDNNCDSSVPVGLCLGK